MIAVRLADLPRFPSVVALKLLAIAAQTSTSATEWVMTALGQGTCDDALAFAKSRSLDDASSPATTADDETANSGTIAIERLSRVFASTAALKIFLDEQDQVDELLQRILESWDHDTIASAMQTSGEDDDAAREQFVGRVRSDFFAVGGVFDRTSGECLGIGSLSSFGISMDDEEKCIRMW